MNDQLLNVKAGFTYWKSDSHWLGFLDKFPDYMTQGESFKDLLEHLTDLYNEFTSGKISFVRRHS